MSAASSKTIVVSLRLPRQVANKIRLMAKSEQETAAVIIRRMLRAQLLQADTTKPTDREAA
jgi:hypothetical protein